jgi:hypothetical protein
MLDTRLQFFIGLKSNFAIRPQSQLPKQRRVLIYLLLSLARVRSSDGLSLLGLLFLGRLHKVIKNKLPSVLH